MIELGKMQKLTVVKKEDFGVYVGETPDAGPKERVLLPAKQVPEGCGEGDEITVFIYRDSSDRLIATTTRPLVLLHGVASLRVKEVTKIGAFLDWGLEKDLFLPFHEQTMRVRAGETCSCPSTSRLCGSAQATRSLLLSMSIRADVLLRQ